MYQLPGDPLAEDHERLMTWLDLRGDDFGGIAPERFGALDGARKFLIGSLVGRARVRPEPRADWRPVAPEEVRGALDEYARFKASFTRGRAARFPLSYVVLDPSAGFDTTDLDRFYERDAGEHVGRFVLYRVRLRGRDVEDGTMNRKTDRLHSVVRRSDFTVYSRASAAA
ncbi:MAG: hypothetical protein LC746_13875 [Acidobacteria bacterium]|nr:hypothetical protein [Acidobacteriota bacterium]